MCAVLWEDGSVQPADPDLGFQLPEAIRGVSDLDRGVDLPPAALAARINQGIEPRVLQQPLARTRRTSRGTVICPLLVIVACFCIVWLRSLLYNNFLDSAFNLGTLVAAAPVFAELIAAPGRTEAFVSSFFEETGIGVDWELPEQVWRLAGRAFQAYAKRRRKQRDAGVRRILADFVIGAHALSNGCRLLGFVHPVNSLLALCGDRTSSR
jgi:predicted nucleic acid-binding protein